jgi:hypothetical protein
MGQKNGILHDWLFNINKKIADGSALNQFNKIIGVT